MKISKEQVAENRQAVLDAAATLFRERGFEGVTVAEIMKAAGLTHGAFYGHFASKDDLITQTCTHALAPDLAEDAPTVGMMDFAEYYLSAGHRDDPGQGCLFPSLGTEAVRASDATRHTLTESIRRRIDNFSQTTAGKTAVERRQAAAGGWAAMVGAVMLSRLVDDKELSDQVLADTLAWLEKTQGKK
ncbi:transcriptional regulator, TetR family [Janthinobacterium sp. Marseille]|nr:TetR/AcrR family transcriptional regulator [Janthinobacterium sp. Marseille]ABR90581.1 transcriptional regulator, TetR family [Janthinobacterium sp. Marseille]